MNKATMIAALQMYLDATFKESHVVTNVTFESKFPDGDVFSVEIDEIDPFAVAKTS